MIQQRLQTENYYSSSDLALVTAISLFCPIEVIDRTDPHKALFLFKRNHDLDQLIESYHRGEIKVNPQTYFNQLRIVKTRLYEDIRR